MNLMDLEAGKWDEELLKLCGGESLRAKLGEEPAPGGTNLGRVSSWWVERFGFNSGALSPLLYEEAVTDETDPF